MKNLNAGAHASPNIQTDSDIYELENRACDPNYKIESFLELKSGYRVWNRFSLANLCKEIKSRVWHRTT